jgi:hypothetical protein
VEKPFVRNLTVIRFAIVEIVHNLDTSFKNTDAPIGRNPYSPQVVLRQ